MYASAKNKNREKVSTPEAFAKLLAVRSKQDNMPPAIVFCYGSNLALSDALYQIYWQAVQKKFISPEEIRINGAEADLANLHAELCTIPLFNTQRVVHVGHADGMFSVAEKKKSEDARKSTSNFIQDFLSLPETTFAFFHFDDKSIAKSFSALCEKAFEIEQEDLKESDLPLYIRNKAAQSGYQLEGGAEILLIEKCGHDAKQTLRELDNLFTYCLVEKKISKDNVQEFCSDLEGALHFAIVEFVAERKIKEAIKKFEQNRMETLQLLYNLLATLFSNAMRYRYLYSLGKDKLEIHARLGLSTDRDWVVNKNERKFRQINHLYSEQEISNILKYCLDLDRRLKENGSPADKKKLMTAFFFFLQDPIQVARQSSLF